MMIYWPIFIDTSTSGISLSASDAKYGLMFCGLSLTLFILFFCFGQQAYVALLDPYTDSPAAAALIKSELIIQAKQAGLTELSAEPPGWGGLAPNLKGNVNSTQHRFLAKSFGYGLSRYRLDMHYDVPKISLYEPLKNEKDAKMFRIMINNDIEKALSELCQDARDAEFRRTGKLPNQ